MAADEDIARIWEECEMGLQANRRMMENHQMAAEETISNIAALRMLNDSGIEEAVKNS